MPKIPVPWRMKNSRPAPTQWDSVTKPKQRAGAWHPPVDKPQHVSICPHEEPGSWGGHPGWCVLAWMSILQDAHGCAAQLRGTPALCATSCCQPFSKVLNLIGSSRHARLLPAWSCGLLFLCVSSLHFSDDYGLEFRHLFICIFDSAAFFSCLPVGCSYFLIAI